MTTPASSARSPGKRGLFESRSGRSVRPELLVEIPAIAVMFIMMLHITLNAFLRAFARAPMAGTLEITQYWYMPIIVFVGFVAAQMRREHVRSDFIYNFLPRVTRRFVLGVGHVLVAIVAVGFAWYSLEQALVAFDVQRVAGASTIPAWPTYFLPPLSFGALAVQLAIFSVQTLQGKTDIESLDDEGVVDYVE